MSLGSIVLEYQFMLTEFSNHMALGGGAGGVRCPGRSADVPLLRPTANVVRASTLQYLSCSVCRPCFLKLVVRQICIDGKAGPYASECITVESLVFTHRVCAYIFGNPEDAYRQICRMRKCCLCGVLQQFSISAAGADLVKGCLLWAALFQNPAPNFAAMATPSSRQADASE